MDELKRRLRADADALDARVSDELDVRIEASLRGIERRVAAPQRDEARPRAWLNPWITWGSSLTGVGLAAAVILAVNIADGPQRPANGTAAPATTAAVPPMPDFAWELRTADFAAPLQHELAAVRADLKRAGKAVQKDVQKILDATESD